MTNGTWPVVLSGFGPKLELVQVRGTSGMVPLRREGQGERPCPGHGSADQVQGGARTHRGNQGSGSAL